MRPQSGFQEENISDQDRKLGEINRMLCRSINTYAICKVNPFDG